MDLSACNSNIKEFSRLIAEKTHNPFEGRLKVGVDLGTANIVLAVTDAHNRPVAGAMCPSGAVRDGIVVDYIGAAETVKSLKHQVEQIIGMELKYAATAIPPGIIPGNVKVISNVVEASGLEVTNVIEEPTAAAKALGISSGAVVDVGGGTTGISILKEGKVIFTADEPTGGTHMTLVLAGFNKISFEEAELLKRERSGEQYVFPIIRPVVEKMVSIVKKYIGGYDLKSIYVVGGACTFRDFEHVFEKETRIKTLKPACPLLVTPLGIAMSCNV